MNGVSLLAHCLMCLRVTYVGIRFFFLSRPDLLNWFHFLSIYLLANFPLFFNFFIYLLFWGWVFPFCSTWPQIAGLKWSSLGFSVSGATGYTITLASHLILYHVTQGGEQNNHLFASNHYKLPLKKKKQSLTISEMPDSSSQGSFQFTDFFFPLKKRNSAIKSIGQSSLAALILPHLNLAYLCWSQSNRRKLRE